MLDQPPPSGRADASEAALVLAAALAASSAPADDAGAGVSAASVEACRRLIADWRESVEAPEIEIRRAGRRLASAFARLPLDAMSKALEVPEGDAAARGLVDACARVDRDFNWDVPLRDVARALVEAAVRAVREGVNEPPEPSEQHEPHEPPEQHEPSDLREPEEMRDPDELQEPAEPDEPH